MKTLAYAAKSATTPLAPFNFQRRDVGNHDVQIELIPSDNINEAYDRLVKSDVKYRFVIDMATLK